jgi:hypothetical protein
VTPRRAPREALGGGRLKGGVFRSHLQWVREHHGAEGVERLVQTLPPEPRKVLSGTILPTIWFPLEWLVLMDRKIMELFGGGSESLLAELGRYAAAINVSTAQRMFDRGSAHKFFRNSALLHGQYQDFGKMTYEESGPSSGTIRQSDCRYFSRIFCGSALGYYVGCIESHGGKDVRVTETICCCFGDPTCNFEMTWS